MLFGKSPYIFKPSFIVKAVAFPGTVLHDKHYLDSEDIDGNLFEQYRRAMAFLKRNLRHVQGNQGFNSPGLLEVPEDVFEELQPESQPESLEDAVLQVLADKPASKADISRKLGQKQVSGQLNKVVRKLLDAGMIEYTIPEKPKSRLQKYRIRSG